MNIFFLDHNPAYAAMLQCDKHVVKMILETAQLLSTAHIVLDDEHVAYRATHQNHPSAVWARQSHSNYRWLYSHMKALGREYQQRYNKVHKTIRNHSVALNMFPKNIPRGDFTFPPQCMPDVCKRDDTVEAYNNYYMHKAREWASVGRPMTWRHRQVMPVHFQKLSA